MSEAFTAATMTTAPTAGVSSGLWTFATPASRISVTNPDVVGYYLAFNGTASATAYDRFVAPGESVVFTREEIGVNKFTTLSAWIPAGSNSAAGQVRGI